MPRAAKVRKQYDTMLVLSAACAAYRINGSYIKEPYQLGDEKPRKTNRELVYSFLEDSSNIQDCDRQQAQDIKTFYQGFTFKVLSGAYLTEFDRNTMKMLEEEFTTEGYNVAVLASVPSSYLKAKKRDEADRRSRFAQGGLIGNVGDKVNMDVEVLKSIYSKNWNTYYISAINSHDQAVFFAYKQEITAGTLMNIKGTVKRHRDDGVTQLNRVKVIK
jgi:hypothetical protein